MDTIFHQSLAKVNDQCQSQTHQTRISKRLSFKNRVIDRSRFTFNNHTFINQHIQT